MTWNTPITWLVDQLVTESDLNEQVRDNLNYLKGRVDTPATAHYTLTETTDYSTSSLTFVDVDNVKLALTLNTNGGDVLVSFFGAIYAPNTQENAVYFDVAVNGVRRGGDEGVIMVASKNGSGLTIQTGTFAFTLLVTGLSAGTHTFKLQWRVLQYPMSLRSGGTTPYNVRSQFWVREVS